MSSGILSVRPQANIYPPLFPALSAGEKAANSSEYAPYTGDLKRMLYTDIISDIDQGHRSY